MKITQALRQYAEEHRRVIKGASEDTIRASVGTALQLGELSPGEFARLSESDTKNVDDFATKVAGKVIDATKGSRGRGAGSRAEELLGGGGRVRVKAPSERYSMTKIAANHHRTGQPVLLHGRPVEMPSEYEHAALGAFVKSLASRSPLGALRGASMTDHDDAMMDELFDRDDWAGETESNQFDKGMHGLRFKALVNDSTSGGSNVVPAFFDPELLTFPLLHGELFPMVTVREVPRGATVTGGSMQNPTVTWGTSEPTSISLFNTDSLIAALSCSIHSVTAAIEVGRDFLSDSPADVGRAITEQMGEKLKAELDRVIAVGTGTSEPEGLFTASGLGTATTAGTWTVDDVEELLFGIGKQYRTSAKCAFVSNDTVYARVRALQNDASGTTDVRRVFGMDHENYQLLGRPAKVQNDIPNTKAIFGDLSRYILYRRLGFGLQWEQGGQTLVRSNTALLVVRGRFGGKVYDGAAFCKATDAPA